MPRTVETIVYEYDELPTPAAKQKARAWYAEIVLNDSWWDCMYDDAQSNAFIQIESFDLYRKECEVSFLQGDLTTLNAIQDNYGKDSPLYKAAKEHEARLDALPELPSEDAPNYAEKEQALCDAKDEAEEEFCIALGKACLNILADEYENIQSEEYLADGIRANEYTFTIDGKRFG